MKDRIVKILIVDDEPDVLSWLSECLSKPEYKIETSSTYAAALHSLEHFRPDIVICDLKLDQNDGMSLLNVAQSFQKPPMFIFLTGYGTIESAVASLRGGAFNFLTKPIDERELSTVIEEALKSSACDALKTAVLSKVTLKEELESRERQIIVSALEKHGWVKSKAASQLGLEPSHLHYKIKKYNISKV